jgi:hypothetical protein
MDHDPDAIGDMLFRGTMRATSKGLNVDSLMQLAISRANDPTVFDEVEPFFFRTRASNSQLDSYFTRMASSSLANYVEDGKRGVQFQNSHNGHGGFLGGGGEVGFGRSLSAELVGTKTAPEAHLDFITQRGLQCGNMSSDQFIQGMRSGIYQDVSIGFMPGRFECSICGGDMLNWRSENGCDHMPGVTYEVKKGSRTVKVQAFAWVHDAHLNEVSIVYDGATPGAGVLAVEKARAMLATGHLSWGAQQAVEGIYRCPVIGPSRHWRGVEARGMDGEIVTTITGEEQSEEQTATATSTATEQEGAAGATTLIEPIETGRSVPAQTGTTEDPLAALRAKWDGTAIKLGTDPVAALEAVGDAYLSLRGQHAAIAQEAADGRAYRASLVEQLKREGVRSLGAEKWPQAEARWLRMASVATTEELRGFIADLAEEGNQRLGAGNGRVTTEGVPPGTVASNRDAKPTNDRNLP